MRKLVLVEFITLDGVMQGLGGPEEDTDGGFTHGGWSRPYLDEAQMSATGKSLSGTTAYLFGRRTYHHMVAFWPHQPDDNPYAKSLNSAPKYVASRTLESADWANTQVIRGDAVPAVRKLKEEGEGSIVVLGSGLLGQDLARHGLVDGYRLFLHPLLLGTGKRLFGELDHPMPLELTDCTPTTTGVLMLSYERA
jgi:dihydrofolate reductase